MKIVKESKEKRVLGLKKVLDYMKKNKIRVVAGVGAFVLTVAILKGLINKQTKEEKINNAISIVQEWTKEDEAIEIKDYLEISKQLNEFMKEHKIVSLSEESLLKTMENTDLKSATVLKQEVQALKTSLKDSNKFNENIYKKIEDLMVQERLVNRYLYNSYYKVYSIVEDALRAYAGEKYGIIDTENLEFKTHVSMDWTEYNVYYGDYENSTSHGIDLSMKKAMNILKDTTIYNDPNEDDNDKYNRERNDILKKGLIEAGNLYNKVENKDLYSAKLSKTIRK